MSKLGLGPVGTALDVSGTYLDEAAELERLGYSAIWLLAARRYADRTATGHPVHVVTSLSPDQMAEYDQPVGIGDLVTVDTTAPVDVAALANLVRTRLRVPV